MSRLKEFTLHYEGDLIIQATSEDNAMDMAMEKLPQSASLEFVEVLPCDPREDEEDLSHRQERQTIL